MSPTGLSPDGDVTVMGGPAPPRVAAICVSHDSRELLPGFVASLQRQTRLAEMRIVVVDSGSSDDSVEVARQLVPAADVLQLPSNLGYAAGINQGIRHVDLTGGADVLVVLNPDITLAEDAVSELARAVATTGAGIAAPTLRDEHGDLLLSLRRRPTLATVSAEALFGGPLAHRLGLPTEVLWDPAQYDGSSQIAWATGGALALSSDCLRVVGPWDESYFLYDEEVDFCLRAADAGFATVHAAPAMGTRRVGAGDSLLAYILMRINRVTLMRRHYGPWVGGAARGALLCGEILRATAGRRQARAALRALARRWDLSALRSRTLLDRDEVGCQDAPRLRAVHQLAGVRQDSVLR